MHLVSCLFMVCVLWMLSLCGYYYHLETWQYILPMALAGDVPQMCDFKGLWLSVTGVGMGSQLSVSGRALTLAGVSWPLHMTVRATLQGDRCAVYTLLCCSFCNHNLETSHLLGGNRSVFEDPSTWERCTREILMSSCDAVAGAGLTPSTLDSDSAGQDTSTVVRLW